MIVTPELAMLVGRAPGPILVENDVDEGDRDE